MLTPDQLAEARRQFASAGGHARAKKMTAEQRSQSARKAVLARHAKARAKK